MATHTISAAVGLSLVTGRLLCKFGDLHKVIENIVGYSVWTHQLPRLAPLVAEHVGRQHPVLRAEVPDELSGDAECSEFVEAFAAEYGDAFNVTGMTKAPQPVNPFAELAEMVGEDRIVVVASQEVE